ncbi:Dyp-type peroxidase [Nonomuraea sp. NPDC047897]|uniref:Dyp-type peroxidase n=1 Tax=Nonomuraea sp. NPDC047897 TaxID=3364346 RepID=UPI00372059A6
MPDQPTRFSRRSLITSIAATAGVGGAVAASGAGDRGTEPAVQLTHAAAPRGTEPFHGPHQAGIATRQQQYGFFAAFDLERVDPRSRKRLTTAHVAANFQHLMERWTAVAERLTRGLPPGPNPIVRPGVPGDSGIADGLDPARLTVTFGLGPELFERIGQRERRPHRLAPLPRFGTDRLQRAWSGGELLVQICGDDAQVISRAFRAVRSRAPGLARLRWSQQGFLGLFGDATPRNLFGHRDGTANPRPGTASFDKGVWAGPDEPDWFAGGTYLVFRKIRMDLPKWDTTTAREQDLTMGRRRTDGAPLSGGHEFTAPDLTRTGADGERLIPPDSHVALVHGIPMLRRSYNYDYAVQAITEPIPDAGKHAHGDADHDDADHDNADHDDAHHDDGHTHDHSGSGHDSYDSGVLFCAYLRDPGEFVRAQRKLAAADRMNAFVRHTGSAVFAVPPGVKPGGSIAAALFRPK